MKRWLKHGLIVVASVLVIAFAAYWAYELSTEHSEQEQYAVYSDYLGDQLLSNDHDFGNAQGLLVILGHSVRTYSLHPFPQASPKMYRDLRLHNLRSTTFERKFSLPTLYKLISSNRFDESTRDLAELTPDESKASLGGYIALSRISFNREGTLALFYTEHLACGLCGGGDLVLMQKRQGHWKVVDDYSPWDS